MIVFFKDAYMHKENVGREDVKKRKKILKTKRSMGTQRGGKNVIGGSKPCIIYPEARGYYVSDSTNGPLFYFTSLLFLFYFFHIQNTTNIQLPYI